MGTQLPPKGAQHPHFLAHVYCGQTVADLSLCWALVEISIKQISQPQKTFWPLLVASHAEREVPLLARSFLLLFYSNHSSNQLQTWGQTTGLGQCFVFFLSVLWHCWHKSYASDFLDIGNFLQLLEVFSEGFVQPITRAWYSQGTRQCSQKFRHKC